MQSHSILTTLVSSFILRKVESAEAPAVALHAENIFSHYFPAKPSLIRVKKQISFTARCQHILLRKVESAEAPV